MKLCDEGGELIMGKIKELSDKIPYWVYNIIGFASGLLGIFGSVCTILIYLFGDFEKTFIKNIFLVVCICGYFSILLCVISKMRKYRAVMKTVIKETSEGYYHFLKESRNTFFDMLHAKKTGVLNIQQLNDAVSNYFVKTLDYLCSIMRAFTGEDVSACVKVIAPESGNADKIELENATVYTLVRSTNSDARRLGNYTSNKPQRVMDNSDFRGILDENSDSNKSYFYKRDLIKYAEEKKKNGDLYRNSTPNWEQFYRGTIVVPIRISHNRLYYSKSKDCYHIIGFLCIDSLSKNAFIDKQERYNVNIVKSFAAEAYIILSKYQYYMRMIKENERNHAKKNI